MRSHTATRTRWQVAARGAAFGAWISACCAVLYLLLVIAGYVVSELHTDPDLVTGSVVTFIIGTIVGVLPAVLAGLLTGALVGLAICPGARHVTALRSRLLGSCHRAK